MAQLEQISEAYEAANSKARTILMVGFNRRFAPQVRRMKSLLETTTEPKSFIVTVNAGHVPVDHWTQSTDIGGGRIVGEACHFFDLLRYLCGYRVSDFETVVMTGVRGAPEIGDKATISLFFEDGSIGTVHYFANGHKSFPKERLEVFCAGRILQLDNFRMLRGWGWRGFRKMHLWRQDKGNLNCVRTFVRAVEDGKPEPTPFEEVYEVSRLSIEIAEAVREKC
jgi:predicted dehydrogenase